MQFQIWRRASRYTTSRSRLPRPRRIGILWPAAWCKAHSLKEPQRLIGYAEAKGRISYLGAVLDPDSMRRVMQWANDDAAVKPEFGELPEGVEVCMRVGQTHTVFVLINHSAAAGDVALPAGMRDVLHDGRSTDHVALAPQGVAVLESNRP
jgi:beta-galactosidase GanA